MEAEKARSEFPEFADENIEIWDANAAWWDDRIGDGNEFQTHLIEPASERLLDISPGEQILDVACGAGRFARRMAALGGSIIAIDNSTEFLERARIRTPKASASSTTSWMPQILPLCSLSALAGLTKPCARWP